MSVTRMHQWVHEEGREKTVQAVGDMLEPHVEHILEHGFEIHPSTDIA